MCCSACCSVLQCVLQCVIKGHLTKMDVVFDECELYECVAVLVAVCVAVCVAVRDQG